MKFDHVLHSKYLNTKKLVKKQIKIKGTWVKGVIYVSITHSS